MLLYLKAIAAAVVAGLAAIVTALDDNSISNSEWCMVVLAVLGSSGVVWYVSNGPGAVYAKAIFGGLTAGFSSLLVALQDNAVSQQEVVTIAIAVVVGLGLVASVPNIGGNEATNSTLRVRRQ